MLCKTIIVCPTFIWCLYLYRGINIEIYDTHFIWRVTKGHNLVERVPGPSVAQIVNSPLVCLTSHYWFIRYRFGSGSHPATILRMPKAILSTLLSFVFFIRSFVFFINLLRRDILYLYLRN